MLSIGEFSAMTHLSVRTLRRYQQAGLLDPARVDPASGYRYYRPDQIRTALTIRRLRELDMPVKEIGELLAARAGDDRDAVLVGHLRRLEERLDQTRRAVATLRELLLDETEHLEVTLRRVQPRMVAAISEIVTRAEVQPWYAAALDELDAVLAATGVTANGPAGAIFDNELFTEDQGRLTVFLPTPAPVARPPGGRVHAMTTSAVDLAVAVHDGPHTDIDIDYGRLGRWVHERGLAIDGPVHETYVTGPRETGESDRWRTEIGWPVKAITR